MKRLKTLVLGLAMFGMFLTLTNSLEVTKVFAHHDRCQVDKQDEDLGNTCILQQNRHYRCDGEPEGGDIQCFAVYE